MNANALPSVSSKYDELPLSEVRLAPSAFKDRMEANHRYLLHLDPQRLLHNFYEHAGLPTAGAVYGGWESQGVAGHTLGHYLSAISLESAATGDTELRKRERLIVDALAACQAKRGTGYVGGIPNEDAIWAEIGRGEVRSQGFDLNGGWVPWYTVHKLFAGLLDAYRFAQDKQALTVVRKLGDWADRLLSGMDDPTFQRMLACEHGGMNDALAQLYAVTGDGKYLHLAQRFFHHALLDPIVAGRDELAGKHANTQIPKVIGLVAIGRLTNDESLIRAGEFFWERVTQHHSYVIGGNSDHEHFGPADQLSDRLSTNTCETCNTYNMLKLSKLLFETTGDWKYMDYYEHALVNHILASQDPSDGMVCYYVSLLPGTARVYSTPDDSFWCCVGTGIENHTKYGEAVAFRHNGGLSFANYVPSHVNDPKSGFRAEVKTQYPESGEVTIRIEQAPHSAAPLEFRIPSYCPSLRAKLNGEPLEAWSGHSAQLVRHWHPGDTIQFSLDFRDVRQVPMPDNRDRIALMQGPNVLAAILDSNSPTGSFDVVKTVKVSPDAGGKLKLEATDGHSAVDLAPFWELTHEKTAVYLDFYDATKWESEKAKREESRRAQADIERRTIDTLRIGEMQDERDHSVAGENTISGEFGGHKWRHATDGGWFSFSLAVNGQSSNTLDLSFWGQDGAGRDFDVLVEGKLLKFFAFDGSQGPVFYNVDIPIPTDVTAGKSRVTVRLQARPGRTAGGLYGAKILRSK